MDQVLVYTLDGSKLVKTDERYTVYPGGGPRHSVVEPRNGTVYVLNEITSSITRFSPVGRQETVSTLPARFSENNSTAEMTMHPNGKFLYASNRGHDSIAVFAVRSDMTLRPVEHEPTGGKTPRNFEISPDGKFLITANQNTGDLFSFRIDQGSGKLKATGKHLKVPSPVCIAFAP